MSNKNKYCVFILSYGRANNVKTIKLLEKQKYTGEYYILCSLDDNTLNQYKNKYGKKILTFDKKISDTDRCYNQGYKAVVFARNEVYKIAEKLGYEYFIVLDDDYTYITNRFYFENNKIENTKNGYLNLDILFSSLHKFYVNANLDVLSISQTGDLIGYNFKYMLAGLSRKSMNLFFLSTSRKVTFKGLTNEDTTMYVIEGMRGKKIFSITNIVLNQEMTQQNQGGLTDIYKEQGTYVKTFYTIMNAPSCVRIKKLGENHFRYHHLIIWNKCLPKIINKKTPQIKV